jgi:hypothetical protein
MSIAEERLRDALFDSATALDESDDLFARVELSIADDRRLRRQRRRRVGVVLALLSAVLAVGAATIEPTDEGWIMDWWILEIMWFAGMAGLCLWLGPFIRRFGKSYAADVFRSNPRTGKSFIVLMDVAYYLIFFAYILFTVQFEASSNWDQTVGADQMRATAVRFGGILLIIGILHGANVISLPMIGRLFTLNRHLDDRAASTPTSND